MGAGYAQQVDLPRDSRLDSGRLQGLVDGLKTVWNPINVGATLSNGFHQRRRVRWMQGKALGAQAGGVLSG